MRDEGDMIAGPTSLTTRQVIVRGALAIAVAYVLLTAVLVLTGA